MISTRIWDGCLCMYYENGMHGTFKGWIDTNLRIIG